MLSGSTSSRRMSRTRMLDKDRVDRSIHRHAVSHHHDGQPWRPRRRTRQDLRRRVRGIRVASGDQVRRRERRTGEQADCRLAASSTHHDRPRHLHRPGIESEDVDAGLVRASDGAYTEYPDPGRDYWQRAVVPALKQISLKAWQRNTGKSAVILIDARRGRRRPHAKHRALLIMYARRRGLLS